MGAGRLRQAARFRWVLWMQGCEARTCILLRPACNGERLARARLAVSEYGTIDALKRAVNHGLCEALEHLILLRLRRQDRGEPKVVVLALVVDVPAWVWVRRSARVCRF